MMRHMLLGSNIREEGLEAMAMLPVFSFHATKVFNTIEGGAVTFFR